jgi:uncharacterized protein
LPWSTTKHEGAWVDAIANPRTVALVNLAGSNPGNRRWTDETMRDIEKSRTDAIAAIGAALNIRAKRLQPEVPVLQASAVGIYGDGGAEFIDELSPAADDAAVAKHDRGLAFRIECLKRIEGRASDLLQGPGCSAVVTLRLGHILGADGGLFPHLALAAQARVCRIGSGENYVPWVHIADAAANVASLTACYATPANTADMWKMGVHNIVAPTSCTQRELFSALGAARGTKPIFPVPGPLFHAAVGPSAGVVTASQRVVARPCAGSAVFRYPTIAAAVASWELMKAL